LSSITGTWQLELGIAISRDAASIKDFADAAQQCLDRDPGWIKFYQDNMQVSQSSPGSATDDELRIAKAQVDFGRLLWARDYVKAAKALEARLDELFQISSAAGAWAALWLGYSYELMGDLSTARTLYSRAHSGAKNIPPLELQASALTQQYSEQILEVARYLDCGPQGFPAILQRFDAATSALKAPGSTVPQIEESVRALGEFLGMNSTRPDKEHGTGPDVLWTSHAQSALCMEIKSDKISAQFYWKKDVSQISDHIQWVKENTESADILPAFVGPILPPAPDANPIPEIVVIELAEFSELADRLRGAVSDIHKTALPLTLRQDVHEIFTGRGLDWPTPYAKMKQSILKSLK
jgi:tetratricopeptide (TPR) repeat protein